MLQRRLTVQFLLALVVLAAPIADCRVEVAPGTTPTDIELPSTPATGPSHRPGRVVDLGEMAA